MQHALISPFESVDESVENRFFKLKNAGKEIKIQIKHK